MPTTWITSTLCLGDVPTRVTGLRLRADTPRAAVRIIEAGGTAVMPRGDFDGAAEVLRLFGADPAWIAQSIASAKGEVALPDDPDDLFPPPPGPRTLRAVE